jgi:hypothetical protein
MTDRASLAPSILFPKEFDMLSILFNFFMCKPKTLDFNWIVQFFLYNVQYLIMRSLCSAELVYLREKNIFMVFWQNKGNNTMERKPVY